MKIFNIVLKEIKHNLRDKQTMFIMVAFPIVLMWILGTAFSDMGGDTLIFENTKVAYSVAPKRSCQRAPLPASTRK